MCEDKPIQDSDLDLLTLWVVWGTMAKLQEYLSTDDESGPADFGHALAVVQDLMDAKERSNVNRESLGEEDHL